MNREEIEALANDVEMGGAIIANRHYRGSTPQGQAIILALRASAAPEEGRDEEVAARAMYEYEPWEDGTTWETMPDASRNAFRETMRFVFAALSPDSRKAEPVAWRWLGRGETSSPIWHYSTAKPNPTATTLIEPLYAALAPATEAEERVTKPYDLLGDY